MEDLTRVPSLLVDPKTSSEAFDALNHAHRQLVAAEVAEWRPRFDRVHFTAA